MLVNKCDTCKAEYREGEYPEWFQLTADKGVIIVDSHHSVTKFPVLDFCTPQCAAEFFTSILATMSDARANVPEKKE